MREFIGGHEAVTTEDYAELAFALWLGDDDESPEERAARLDAAADLFEHDPDLAACAVRAVTTYLAGRATLLPCPSLPSAADHTGAREVAA